MRVAKRNVARQTQNKAVSSSSLSERYYAAIDVVRQTKDLNLNSSHTNLPGCLAMSA